VEAGGCGRVFGLAEALGLRPAVGVMHALSRPTAPMGALLERIAGPDRDGPSILRSHPLTPDRKAMLEAAERPLTGPPLLDETEWQALKRICDR
jgi:hypothetical protein